MPQTDELRSRHAACMVDAINATVSLPSRFFAFAEGERSVFISILITAPKQFSSTPTALSMITKRWAFYCFVPIVYLL